MATEEQEKSETKNEGIPLWAFALLVGGVAAGVAGYLYFKKRSSLSSVMPHLALPITGHDMVIARDAFAEACGGCGRDLSITAADPRLGAKYILTGT